MIGNQFETSELVLQGNQSHVSYNKQDLKRSERECSSIHWILIRHEEKRQYVLQKGKGGSTTNSLHVQKVEQKHDLEKKESKELVLEKKEDECDELESSEKTREDGVLYPIRPRWTWKFHQTQSFPPKVQWRSQFPWNEQLFFIQTNLPLGQGKHLPAASTPPWLLIWAYHQLHLVITEIK